MNKKGFTLVELLGVIIILVIIAGITIPAINASIKTAKQNAYDKQITTLEDAAKRWGASNDAKLPDIGSSSIVIIDFDRLISEGYLKDEPIIDPKTKEELTGCIKISYDIEYNQYKYEYIDNELTCESNG